MKVRVAVLPLISQTKVPTAHIRRKLHLSRKLLSNNGKLQATIGNDRGYSFERNCVLRRWESETLIKIDYQPQGR